MPLMSLLVICVVICISPLPMSSSELLELCLFRTSNHQCGIKCRGLWVHSVKIKPSVMIDLQIKECRLLLCSLAR